MLCGLGVFARNPVFSRWREAILSKYTGWPLHLPMRTNADLSGFGKNDSEGTINITPMPELDDHQRGLVVANFVHDPVLALSDSITIMAGDFLAAWRPRFLTQPFDSADDALPVFLGGNGRKFLLGRGLDQNPIFCHCASVP